MTNRVLLGQFGTDYCLRATRPGYNVLVEYANSIGIAFDSRKPSNLRVYASGRIPGSSIKRVQPAIGWDVWAVDIPTDYDAISNVTFAFGAGWRTTGGYGFWHLDYSASLAGTRNSVTLGNDSGEDRTFSWVDYVIMRSFI